VPGPTISTDGFVLLKRPPSESFEALTVFSPTEGVLRVLHRVPRRPSLQHIPLDLFDEVTLWLEAGQSGTWFVKEARLLRRHTEIGRRYSALQAACALTELIARNPLHEESRLAVHQLLRVALDAFEKSDRPDVVYFKSLYCLARDEGHPLKQHWLPTLPADARADVTSLLNQPVADQTLPTARVAQLRQSLETYLRGHAEFM
jgi:recombinational DNA repair protein (RecF pathway)